MTTPCAAQAAYTARSAARLALAVVGLWKDGMVKSACGEGSEKAPRRFEEVVEGCEARLGRPDAQPAPRPPGEMQARYRRDKGEVRLGYGQALAEMQPKYGRGTAEVRLRYGPGLRAHPSCSARYSLPCVNSSDGSGPVQQRAQRGGVDSFRSDGQRLEAEAAAAHLSAGFCALEPRVLCLAEEGAAARPSGELRGREAKVELAHEERVAYAAEPRPRSRRESAELNTRAATARRLDRAAPPTRAGSLFTARGVKRGASRPERRFPSGRPSALPVHTQHSHPW